MQTTEKFLALAEEFRFASKNSQVNAKELHDSGRKMIGVFCTYFPKEIAHAAGAAVVSLCSTSNDTIADAEKDLPRNLCPLIKSSYGFAKTERCPYFYFSDLVVGETTCDGKKKMYEYLAELKPVYVMELPNSQSEEALELWKKEIIKFKNHLEEYFEVEITEEKIRDAVRLLNRERAALNEFYTVSKPVPSPVSGLDLYKIMNGTGFIFDKEKAIAKIEEVTAEIKNNMGKENGPRKPRIIITGCPLGGVAEKMAEAVELAGGEIVAYENCNGFKNTVELIDENAPDIYDAIARRYLNIGCSVMTPNSNRIKLLGELIDEYSADGVIDVILQACHTYNVETLAIKRLVNSKDKSYMTIETDFSTADVGQINTRVGAFVEML